MAHVIVNSGRWGGSAGGVVSWSSSAGNAWISIVLHELGHSLFHLADEYDYRQGCGIDTNRDNAPIGEPNRVNVTQETDRSKLKWKHLIDSTTPIPTMQNPDCAQCDRRANTPPPNTTIGLYEGAYCYHCGYYRPAYSCKMRNSGEDFCEVCTEVIIQDLSKLRSTTVVVWEDDKDQNGFYQIYARSLHLDSSENIHDFTVNSVAKGQQRRPDIAMDYKGNFVVVWEDDKNENNIYQIYARGFNASGSEKFSDFTVNSVGKGQQLVPAIDMSGNGDFVVVWQDDMDGNGYYQIRARGFHADGSEKFHDFTVNSVAKGQQLKPKVAMGVNGDFVVVWQDDKDENGYYQIRARGFHADGSELFSDITVNSVAKGQQLIPVVAMSGNGDFVVVWQDDKDQNGYYQIRARGFHADGSERLGDFTVNSISKGQQLKPDIAIALNGDFIIVWQDDKDEKRYYQIRARGFHADGSEKFHDITVNSISKGQQLKPKVAMDDYGGFIVVWEDDNNMNCWYQIKARCFYPNGSEKTPDFTVNSVARGHQLKPAVAIRFHPCLRLFKPPFVIKPTPGIRVIR